MQEKYNGFDWQARIKVCKRHAWKVSQNGKKRYINHLEGINEEPVTSIIEWDCEDGSVNTRVLQLYEGDTVYTTEVSN